MEDMESTTTSGPNWMMVIYHLPFLLQLGLLHQKFQSKTFERHQGSLRLIRIGLVPINIFLGVEIMYKFTMKPLTRRGPLNLQFACWTAHLVMRSIEWGFQSTFNGDPTFQLRPEFHPKHQILQSQEKEKENENEITEKSSESETASHPGKNSETNHDSYQDVLVWSIHQLTSLRGINYVWGWKGRKQEKPTLSQTLRLTLISHVGQVMGVIPLVMIRDHGSPTNALLALGVPNFIGLRIVAEGLGTFAWGLLCVYGMEFGFCLLTLMAHLINFFSENVWELPCSFMQWWDLRLFVPVFGSPLSANSLVSLWSYHWHQVYRRSFKIVGAQPATILATKLGLSIKFKRLFGLLGAFIVSAIFHEVAIKWTAQSSHPSAYQFFHQFPGSLLYFLMQPLGIIVEPYIIPLIPKWMGGGSLWVLVFTLITAQQFRDQYAFHDRVIDDTYPPFRDWPWIGVLWPSSIMQS
ncbi:hypothetical protein MJO28_008539 [Puccinia striiformis f. sp. tritici]|uniref:Wax synthase domain-containing protein n=2 Tax=Puccinia striiformis TaxID=27350 RepID=A0A2S4V4T2_9BASI|nr:hypothetical protein Pst134EA_015390 [Puccinia striiformis f. sp. tritici]KAH9463307.1 hypothetical protein Pst134EA_015390 [Puccinia striiformis f. sp. tritici]KAI7949718.1 hypothetical protein MJO28_008539 [Puccinia striiformis f. sp. tritici]POW04533.1 hypothetical protein PSTT_10285 [Puccinia striiformis]